MWSDGAPVELRSKFTNRNIKHDVILMVVSWKTDNYVVDSRNAKFILNGLVSLCPDLFVFTCLCLCLG